MPNEFKNLVTVGTAASMASIPKHKAFILARNSTGTPATVIPTFFAGNSTSDSPVGITGTTLSNDILYPIRMKSYTDLANGSILFLT